MGSDKSGSSSDEIHSLHKFLNHKYPNDVNFFFQTYLFQKRKKKVKNFLYMKII